MRRKMADTDTGKSLFKMYNKDGGTVLAHRLNKLLFPIKNEADVALHNDIWCEVLQIVEGQERSFLKGLVDCILYKPVDRRKRFLLRVATLILEIGQKKGNL